MKKVFFFLGACWVLAACSSKPEAYKCINEADSNDIQSLSIKKDSAILGFSTYKAKCHVNGNNVIYANNEEDCKDIGVNKASNLIFDTIIYRVITNDASFSGAKTQKIYSCERL